ncbi:MAG: cupin domain-containing protein [Deltaproteobacteria bacterium]|nr:cupin domain-containing protein [Deltaproteobacteria bacterium]
MTLQGPLPGSSGLKDSALRGSLGKNIPAPMAKEFFETICRHEHVRIERIVSWGQASPEGFWFDQADNEFVLLIEGRAALKFENEAETVVLEAGDYLDIKAHVRHRVEWTAAEGATIWLAVFY